MPPSTSEASTRGHGQPRPPIRTARRRVCRGGYHRAGDRWAGSPGPSWPRRCPNAGGLGIIETSSGDLDAVRDEIRKMRDLTDRPFGVNIAQLFVRDPTIVEFVVDQGVRFVTTSAGDPNKYTAQLKGAGLTVFHVVPTLAAARKAVDAGVDGLVVEGGEGGGFKTRATCDDGAAPLVCSHLGVPVDRRRRHLRRPHDGGRLRARRRGRADGHPDGVGGRVAGARQLEAAIVAAPRPTVFLNRFSRPGLRALRTERSTRLEQQDHVGSRSSARRRTSTSAETWRPRGARRAGRGPHRRGRPVAQVIAETMPSSTRPPPTWRGSLPRWGPVGRSPAGGGP